MKLLYALLVTGLVVSQGHADLGNKLAAAQDQIETIKQNLDSSDFLAKSECGGKALAKCGRIGSCGQACGGK